MEKDPRKLIRKYAKARAKAQEKGDLKEEAELVNVLGGLNTEIGEHVEALGLHREELALCEATADTIGQAVAHRKIGESYVSLDNFTKAIQHQNRHLELATLAKNVAEQQRAYATIGRTYLIQGEELHHCRSFEEAKSPLRRAENAFRNSIKLSKLLEESNGLSAKEAHLMKVRGITNLGLVYHYMALASSPSEQGSYETQSLNLLQKAVDISQRHMLSSELHRAYIHLTSFYRDRRKPESAIRYAEEAYKRAKVVRNTQWQMEALTVLSDVHRSTGSTKEAKRALKKTYRLTHSSEEKSELREKLKSVVKIHHMKAKVDNASTSDEEKFKFHEMIADKFCEAYCFQAAINHYKAQESLFPLLDSITEKQKASVYFSLAVTNSDLNNDEIAIEYYNKELEYSTEPRGLAKTWSQIGTSKEKLAMDPFDVERCYEKALEHAEETGDCKLQMKMLNLLQEFQDKKKLPSASETRRKLADLQMKSGLLLGDVEEDSEDICGAGGQEEENGGSESDATDDDSESLVEAELKVISSDDSDAEETRKSRNVGKVWRRKLNEKGETPLHRACIDGHLKRVQLLLEQGHPVNAADFAGWIPLHEACNHGFKEIVSVLLAYGANANYSAYSTKSEGTTPMQDAAGNGHLEIVALLLEKGANPNIKNEKGKTALDALEAWFSSCEADLDSYDVECYSKLRSSMIDAMDEGVNKENTNPINSFQEMNDIFDSEIDTQRTVHVDGGFTQSQNRDRSPPPPRLPRTTQNMKGHSRPNGTFSHSSAEVQPTAAPMPSQYSSPTQNIADFDEEGIFNDIGDDSNFTDSQILPTLDPVARRGKSVPCTDTTSNVGDSGDGISGADEYRHALAGLGGSDSVAAYSNFRTSRASKRPSVDAGPSNAALLQEDDNYVGDDWLIDDTDDVICTASSKTQHRADTRPFKRPKTVHLTGTGQTTFGSYGWPHSASVKKTAARDKAAGFSSSFLNRSSVRGKTAPKKLITTKIKDFLPEQNPGDEDFAIDDDDEISSSPSTSVPQPTFPSAPSVNTSTSHPTQSYIPPSFPQPTQSVLTSMRVKVKISGKMFLIAVQKGATVSWLCERASVVYKRNTGLQPKLALYTGGTANEDDTCLLANDDLVSDVLQSNEHVLAKIESFEVIPLSQKYEEACKESKTVIMPAILDICQQSKITERIDLKNRGLLWSHLKPLISVLGQQKITSLLLPGNQLCDDGMKSLCESMMKQMNLNSQTESHLIELNLRCVNMTPAGLKKLAEAAGTGGFQALQDLDISYNRLGDSCTEAISAILRSCTKLRILKASCCRFTRQMFQTNYQVFRSAMQGCVHLTTLDVSSNNIGSFGVEMLLKSLPSGSITTLNLSAVCDNSNNSLFLRHIQSFLSQDFCQLRNLRLSSNQLTKDVLQEFKETTGIDIC